MVERDDATPYLSACAIYRDEGPYLREWVEFHKLVGVERFFLYNNDSTDEHRVALAPYLEEGTVVLHEWPISPGQIHAYRHCLETHSHDSHWIAFLDLDEFIFSPTGEKLPEILPEYEQWPGVTIHRASFGTSGHKTKPSGLVLENYVRRTNDPLRNSTFKSIVNPREAIDLRNPESFIYRGGAFAVDENKKRAPEDPTPGRSSWERFRMNHYVTKSVGEWRQKIAKPTADTNDSRVGRLKHLPRLEALLNQQPDDVIHSYLPALRDALRRTAERSGQLAETG